jgi:hypothetical protein
MLRNTLAGKRKIEANSNVRNLIKINKYMNASRNNSVGKATDYELDTNGRKFVSRKGKMLLFSISFRSVLGPTQWPQRKGDHSPPTSAEVTKTWIQV